MLDGAIAFQVVIAFADRQDIACMKKKTAGRYQVKLVVDATSLYHGQRVISQTAWPALDLVGGSC